MKWVTALPALIDLNQKISKGKSNKDEYQSLRSRFKDGI